MTDLLPGLRGAIEAHQSRLARMRDSREAHQEDARGPDGGESKDVPTSPSAPALRAFEERKQAGVEAAQREARIVARTLLAAADAALRCEGDETTRVRVAQKLRSMIPPIPPGTL